MKGRKGQRRRHSRKPSRLLHSCKDGRNGERIKGVVGQAAENHDGRESEDWRVRKGVGEQWQRQVMKRRRGTILLDLSERGIRCTI